MSGLGRRDNRHERPYVIAYIRPDGRKLYDSARTLDDARARIDARLAKRHNRGETATVHLGGKLVLDTAAPTIDWYREDVSVEDMLNHIVPKR